MSTAGDQAEGAYAPAPIPEKEVWVPTPRGSIYAKVWSQGCALEPIVLLHDSLGCVALWRNFPEALARATGRTVVAYDRLGFGRSAPLSGPISFTYVSDEAEQVVHVLRACLDADAFIPFGHSIGGGMALATAARYPDHCRSVISESAQAYVDDRIVDGVRDESTALRNEGLERLARYHGDKAEWVLNAWSTTWTDPAFAAWSLNRELRSIQCPALIIHGDADEYASTTHPEHMKRVIPAQTVIEIVPSCGHIPHRERPAEVLSLVQRFLAPSRPGPT